MWEKLSPKNKDGKPSATATVLRPVKFIILSKDPDKEITIYLVNFSNEM